MTSSAGDSGGIVPPPYPHDRLDVREEGGGGRGRRDDRRARWAPPSTRCPKLRSQAFTAAAPVATGLPGHDRERRLPRGRVAMDRPPLRCEVTPTRWSHASAPRRWSRRCRGPPVAAQPIAYTVLYPAGAYPTYAMGATSPTCRRGAGALRRRLARRPGAGVRRRRLALVLWLNDPSNPTGVVALPAEMQAAVERARARGIVVASDECYVEFTYDADGRAAAPVTALTAVERWRARCALVVEALEPGRLPRRVRRRRWRPRERPRRAAQARRDDDPGTGAGRGPRSRPGHDEHVRGAAAALRPPPRQALPALEARGLVHDGGTSTFYLWLRDATGEGRDGWAIAADLATTGLIVAPGDFDGEAGAQTCGWA